MEERSIAMALASATASSSFSFVRPPAESSSLLFVRPSVLCSRVGSPGSRRVLINYYIIQLLVTRLFLRIKLQCGFCHHSLKTSGSRIMRKLVLKKHMYRMQGVVSFRCMTNFHLS